MKPFQLCSVSASTQGSARERSSSSPKFAAGSPSFAASSSARWEPARQLEPVLQIHAEAGPSRRISSNNACELPPRRSAPFLGSRPRTADAARYTGSVDA